MSVFFGLSRFFSSSAGAVNGSSVNYHADVNRRTRPRELTDRDLYAILRAFYLQNGLYEALRDVRFGVDADTANLKAIRNPSPAIIDFWSDKGFPSPLVLTTPRTAQQQDAEQQTTETDPLIDAIEQVWAWSNWRRRLPYVAWACALFGEVYLKVVADKARGRVWFEVIEPEYVFDFEEDERDNLTWIRLDVPKCDTDHETGETRRYTRTEVWSKADGTYRVWETDGDQYGKPLNQFGAMIDEESGALAELDIDFLPFVRIPFREVGQKRGIGAILVLIEAMVEADLMATNLHGVLFNDLEATTVITRDGVDVNNRPLPPVSVRSAEPQFDANGHQIASPGRQTDGSVTLGKRTLVSLPGGAHLEHTVPPIDYDAALLIQQDHDTHLERLAPELAYSKISEMSGSDLSGRAIRFKLTPAVDRVEKVRPNLLDGLKAADMMAVTLGQVNGIAGFEGLGTFADGSLEHGFMEQAILPVSDYEDAQTRHEQASAMQAEQSAGLPLGEILKRSGYSEIQAAEVVSMAADAVDTTGGEETPPEGQGTR